MLSSLTHRIDVATKYTLPFVVQDNLFTEEELQAIETYCNLFDLDDGQILNKGKLQTVDQTRKCKLKLHNINPDNGWIFDRLSLAAEFVNKEYFRFDLTGFDYFQYTEYQSNGDHYNYHADILFGNKLPPEALHTRKLSLSLILSDPSEYEGGEFEFLYSSTPMTVPQKRGSIIAFPSWMVHRVAPLTSGLRKSLVYWVVGPKFK
jgi:PKHD-type hydroxylase